MTTTYDLENEVLGGNGDDYYKGPQSQEELDRLREEYNRDHQTELQIVPVEQEDPAKKDNGYKPWYNIPG